MTEREIFIWQKRNQAMICYYKQFSSNPIDKEGWAVSVPVRFEETENEAHYTRYACAMDHNLLKAIEKVEEDIARIRFGWAERRDVSGQRREEGQEQTS